MIRFLAVLLVAAAPLAADDAALPDLTRYEVLADVIAHHRLPALVLVDVRSPEEFRSGHLPGAVNIPLERVFSDYPSNSALAPIVVYGKPASSDARKAADILTTRGYKHVILFGSISKWEGALE